MWYTAAPHAPGAPQDLWESLRLAGNALVQVVHVVQVVQFPQANEPKMLVKPLFVDKFSGAGCGLHHSAVWVAASSCL